MLLCLGKLVRCLRVRPGICEGPRGSSLGLQGPVGIRATPCQPGPGLSPSRADLAAPLASQFWRVAPCGLTALTQWGRHCLHLLRFIVRTGEAPQHLTCQP